MPATVLQAPSPVHTRPHTPASAPRLSTPLQRARAVKGWTQRQAVAELTATATGWGWQLCTPESLRRQLTRWESGAGRPDASYRALLAHVYGTTETVLGLVDAPRAGVDFFGEAVPQEREPRAVIATTVHLTFYELLGLFLFEPDTAAVLADPGDAADDAYVASAVPWGLAACTLQQIESWARRARTALETARTGEEHYWAVRVAPIVTRVFGVARGEVAR